MRVGMTLAQARALCAHVTHFEHEPHRDAVAMEALGRWMMRFSPVVALAHERGVFLDLTGCERAFGGLGNILEQVSAAMKRFRIGVTLAIAPTPGAAWAIAVASGATGRIVPDEVDLHIALKSLPPFSLRISQEIAASLHHLGIDTIGQLMRLPRETLPARFGHELLMRLDQALGRIAEPLVPLEPFSPIEARMDFDGAVDSLEAIWIVFKRLLTKIIPELLKRGHGARELEVEFFRPYAITLRKTIHLSRPSRDPGNLFNLLRCAMETLETDVGFLGIRLTIARSQRVSDEQIHLLEHEEFIAETELSHLIERLCIRLGDEILAQPVLVESYVPERAWMESTNFAPPFVVSSLRRFVAPIRPLHLMKSPQEIRVMVSPSHDRDGRPVAFTWCSQVHRLSHTVGPERIAGQWWQGHRKTRDYFDVEDDQGSRFWIFRVNESGKWFVHGEFE
jgi:protein ImuB